MQKEILKEKADLYEKDYWNEHKKAIRAQKTVQNLKEKLRKERNDWEEEKKVLIKQGKKAGKEITQLQQKLNISQQKISDLCVDKENLCANVHRLDKQVSRADTKKDRAVLNAIEKTKNNTHTFHIKEKGIVTDDNRDLIWDFVKVGLKPGMINTTINTVLATAGVQVKGSVLCYTARAAVIEGRVAAELQLAKAMNESKGMIS